MESVEFYARLLWQSMQIGGPQELNEEQVQRLYELRRQMGLPGKHPANLCPNAKAGAKLPFMRWKLMADLQQQLQKEMMLIL